jgi:hypothetical protein
MAHPGHSFRYAQEVADLVEAVGFAGKAGKVVENGLVQIQPKQALIAPEQIANLSSGLSIS